jgi:hypothetical protein
VLINTLKCVYHRIKFQWSYTFILVFTFTECTRTVCLCPKLGDFLSSSIYIYDVYRQGVFTFMECTRTVCLCPKLGDF